MSFDTILPDILAQELVIIPASIVRENYDAQYEMNDEYRGDREKYYRSGSLAQDLFDIWTVLKECGKPIPDDLREMMLKEDSSYGSYFDIVDDDKMVSDDLRGLPHDTLMQCRGNDVEAEAADALARYYKSGDGKIKVEYLETDVAFPVWEGYNDDDRLGYEEKKANTKLESEEFSCEYLRDVGQPHSTHDVAYDRIVNMILFNYRVEKRVASPGRYSLDFWLRPGALILPEKGVRVIGGWCSDTALVLRNIDRVIHALRQEIYYDESISIFGAIMDSFRDGIFNDIGWEVYDFLVDRQWREVEILQRAIIDNYFERNESFIGYSSYFERDYDQYALMTMMEHMAYDRTGVEYGALNLKGQDETTKFMTEFFLDLYSLLFHHIGTKRIVIDGHGSDKIRELVSSIAKLAYGVAIPVVSYDCCGKSGRERFNRFDFCEKGDLVVLFGKPEWKMWHEFGDEVENALERGVGIIILLCWHEVNIIEKYLRECSEARRCFAVTNVNGALCSFNRFRGRVRTYRVFERKRDPIFIRAFNVLMALGYIPDVGKASRDSTWCYPIRLLELVREFVILYIDSDINPFGSAPKFLCLDALWMMRHMYIDPTVTTPFHLDARYEIESECLRHCTWTYSCVRFDFWECDFRDGDFGLAIWTQKPKIVRKSKKGLKLWAPVVKGEDKGIG